MIGMLIECIFESFQQALIPFLKNEHDRIAVFSLHIILLERCNLIWFDQLFFFKDRNLKSGFSNWSLVSPMINCTGKRVTLV